MSHQGHGSLADFRVIDCQLFQTRRLCVKSIGICFLAGLGYRPYADLSCRRADRRIPAYET
jgi:hypothetical protein